MKKIKSFTVYDLSVVGVMAAVCFVVTYFIHFTIQTPAGPVMIKLANAFCLLAGMLFGGLRGGLAAGIGSMLFDLMDPLFFTDAPFTLIRFFLMAFLCGLLCRYGRKKGKEFSFNIIGAATGSVFSFVFYFAQSVIKQLLLGQPMGVALVTVTGKAWTSLLNTVIAIVLACLLAPLFKEGLKRAGLYKKLHV